MSTGFLTRRLAAIHAQVPYPDFHSAIYRTVFSAILRAWDRLVDEEGAGLASCNENEVTASLQEILEDLRQAPEPPVAGFTSNLFETVNRDGSLVSHDLTHLEKKPDLTFRLIEQHPGVRSSLYRAIFVECKIVSRRSRSVRLYCTKGIGRFVRGEYAWAMPAGVMVAYARDGCTVVEHLVPHLTRGRARAEDSYSTCSLPRAEPRFGSSPIETHSSRHGRPHSRDGRPGDIKIYHLWLPEDHRRITGGE